MEEIPLTGGRASTGVVRVGDTVRRPQHPRSAYTQALLRQLETHQVAPRFLGLDEQGREILGYVAGATYPSPAHVDEPAVPLRDAQIASAARLVRRFHDATAGTPLAAHGEVVCHRDLGPHNIVFQGDEAVVIIDWDEDAGPGPRLEDVSHAVWCLAEVGPQGGAVEEIARRVTLACLGYGWTYPEEVVDAIAARFRRGRDWYREQGLSEGEAVFQSFVDWMEANGPELRRLVQVRQGRSG